MKNTKKLLVAIIILSLLLVNSVLFKMNIVHAAEAVNIYVEDYSDGVLTIRWTRLMEPISLKLHIILLQDKETKKVMKEMLTHIKKGFK